MKHLLRIARGFLMPLGLAVLVTVGPSASMSWAAPEPDTTSVGTPPVSSDPDDAPWPGDEDDEDQPPTMQEQAPIFPPAEKGVTAEPDSVLKAKTTVPAAGAGIDSTFLKPTAAAKKPLNAPPKERNPPLGLHPAVLFLGLLVGHIFAVRAVSD